MTAVAEFKTVAEFEKAPEEYKHAFARLCAVTPSTSSTARRCSTNPPSSTPANPYAKWLTCRVAMEEYGHHVRFRELGAQIGLTDEDMSTKNKRPLSIFEFKLKNWAEFCVIKLLADLAEILQVEDLLHCSFHPLRNLARSTMPEERFHADFGVQFCTELCKTPEGKAAVQAAIDEYFPVSAGVFRRGRLGEQ